MLTSGYLFGKIATHFNGEHEMAKWKLNVFVKDARSKAGERGIDSFLFENINEEGMKSVVKNMELCAFPSPKYRIEFHPSTKTVKNLMTGNDIEIDYDTPHCCNPSTETYWSM